jgi:hypothetical protein
MSDVLYIPSIEPRSFATKKAARNAGLRGRTQWIRAGFAVQDGAIGVQVKNDVFFAQSECEPALDVVAAAVRGLAPRKGAVAVQHDAKSLRRPIYRLSDLEVRKPLLSELGPLSSAETDQLLGTAGHIGYLASAIRGCNGVDAEYYLSKVELLLREHDCGMQWGYIELTVNGGTYWNYLVVDLPVGQFVMPHCYKVDANPAYPGDILDRSTVRDYARRDAIRHAFVEWVYSNRSGSECDAERIR